MSETRLRFKGWIEPRWIEAAPIEEPTGIDEEPGYLSVADYDAVLRCHCRLDEEG
jgi:hypothetical protein